MGLFHGLTFFLSSLAYNIFIRNECILNSCGITCLYTVQHISILSGYASMLDGIMHVANNGGIQLYL